MSPLSCSLSVYSLPLSFCFFSLSLFSFSLSLSLSVSPAPRVSSWRQVGMPTGPIRSSRNQVSFGLSQTPGNSIWLYGANCAQSVSFRTGALRLKSYANPLASLQSWHAWIETITSLVLSLSWNAMNDCNSRFSVHLLRQRGFEDGFRNRSSAVSFIWNIYLMNTFLFGY